MTKRALLLVLMCGLAAPALAQNTKDKPQPTTPSTLTPKATTPAKPDMKGGDMMGDWAKASQLGPEHIEMNKNMVGEWDAKSSFWMQPKAEPMVSDGHAKFDTVMGARFVTQDYTGKMSMPGADGKVMEMPFKGHGVFAFNTVTKEYEYTWYDSTATGIMLSTGKKDAKGDIVYQGTYDDPMSGQKKTAKSVIHFEGKDKMTFTMYDKGTDGAEFKNLEVVYTRAVPSRMSEPKADKPKTEEKKTPGS